MSVAEPANLESSKTILGVDRLDDTLFLEGENADTYVAAWEVDPSYYAACQPGPAFYPDMRRGRTVYLSGVNAPGLQQLEQSNYDIGLLLQPGNGTKAQAHTFRLWAADNGCFAEASGKPWSEEGWFTWLNGLATDERLRWGCWGFDHESRQLVPGAEQPEPIGCLFATAPDVVCDPVATWRRSAPWFHRVRELGLPVALVAQNGLERFPNAWDEHERWDCLFLGGGCKLCLAASQQAGKPTRCKHPDHFDWKLSADARDCVREAQALGKWVHMGRVNSGLRLRLAAAWGCDSADGTYLRFGGRAGAKKNLPRLMSWLDELRSNPVAPAPTFWQEFEARWEAEQQPHQLHLIGD